MRIYGHLPERAASVKRDPAERRASRSKFGNKDADNTTKPSRSRASSAVLYGSVFEVLMFGDVDGVVADEPGVEMARIAIVSSRTV